MKAAAGTALLVAALIAGCGGGNADKQASSPAPAQASTPPPSVPAASQPAPTATTNTPPTKHRTKPDSSSSAPLKVTGTYTCKGQKLKALSAGGPVKVDPRIVRPGQRFTVTVTDPTVKVAVVTLTGVASKPIQVDGHDTGDGVAAQLTMPGYASCGNKLLELEGDLSAEAYVAVAG